MDVQAGYLINNMGNKGASSAPHLHYEVDYNGVFGSSIARSFSILETLVPETDDGTYPPVNGKVVTTCYQ
jgi:murein DD-endopeptidase MepM/ murein hydrolase activator NlpD